MLSRLKISTKLILLVFILVAIGVMSESIISYVNNKKSLEDEYLQKLTLVSDVFEENIDSQFEEMEEDLIYLLRNKSLTDYFELLNKYVQQGDDTAKLYRDFYHDIFLGFQDVYKFDDIYLMNEKGVVLYQYGDSLSSGHKFKNIDNQVVDLHIPKFHVNKPVFQNKHFFVYATLPVLNDNGKLIGVLAAKINANKILNKAIPRLIGSGGDLEVLTYKLHKNDIYRLSESSLPLKMIYKQESNEPIHVSVKKIKSTNNQGYYKHIDDELFLATWKHLEKLDIGLLVMVNQNTVFSSLNRFNAYTVLSALCILIISLILANFFSKVLLFPVLRLKKVLGLVSHGILPKNMETSLKDEIGEMIIIVNKIVSSLKKTALFAQRIGEGDFDAKYKPISNKDALGHALVNMSESLQRADSKDNLRNWIVTGVADIGGILRNNDTLKELGDDILEYICDRVGAVQGVFFVVETDETEKYLRVESSYAYSQKKYLSGKHPFDQGLIGQAAIEREVILRTEIPENYTKITSGLLGDRQASCLMIIPLITNDIVYGVIEIASFDKFTEGETQFMKEVSEIIARTIFNIKVNENTKRLLEESQRMSSELKVQQEELKHNAIEMEKSQIEIQKSNDELEVQISEVNNAQNRIQALLQNASEVIVIYNKSGEITYVSPSVESILGYGPSDLLGKSDLNLVSQNEQPIYTEMLEDLQINSNITKVVQISYFKKTGDLIWLEASGRNLLSDPAIQGIVVNYRDITERRRAEEEEKKRGQMQALSENSLDLIMRMSDKGKIFYINPVISSLTGKSPADILNKSLDEIDLLQTIKDDWESISEEVFKTKKKVSREIVFSSLKGELIMHINAIPEFNAKNKVNSVLIVAHDITEAKQIENEIKEKNQKINDSINYAENIQEAILPDSSLVKKALRDSFINFKPRDVVSGDFPWYMEKDGAIYIAAVDCTGHGVPGALISLVGYFLLNNIVENNADLDASMVLDLLDESVTDTFKQNLDSSKIKDGMDIALCKIDLNKQELQYAGANRPLYYVNTEGDLSEYKGDKFPIGGGKAYVNKTKFTNNVINYSLGDSIFFFSDGFPDQFGGLSGDEKLGTKRIKEILHKKINSLEEINVQLNDRFENWMGDTKQTDDVLMIGVRF